LISVAFAVVESYPVRAITIELAFPAPQTVEPVADGPYCEEGASAVTDASCAVVPVPLNVIVDVSPVGNV
jgi:hypothetical protein